MKQWGIFTTKDALNDTIKIIVNKGLEIFEVRKLTFIEKLTYLSSNDIELFMNEPYIVMFYATKYEYNELVKWYDFSKVNIK